jgi:hypothetical protein
MVYNSVTKIQLPHHNASNLHALSAYHKNMNFIKGQGMGSVLLKTGGPGAASSSSHAFQPAPYPQPALPRADR